MVTVDDEVLRVGLRLNIGLLDDLGRHGSSALDADFERLMLHQGTHCSRTQSVVSAKASQVG